MCSCLGELCWPQRGRAPAGDGDIPTHRRGGGRRVGGRGLSEPPGPRPPLDCRPGDRSFTSLPGTPKAGVSQADSPRVARIHTLICSGFGKGRLNWNSLGRRPWSSFSGTGHMCVLARGGDFFFLKCILPGHCQSVDKSRQRKVAVGNYISQLPQAPQGGTLIKERKNRNSTPPPQIGRAHV